MFAVPVETFGCRSGMSRNELGLSCGNGFAANKPKSRWLYFHLSKGIEKG